MMDDTIGGASSISASHRAAKSGGAESPDPGVTVGPHRPRKARTEASPVRSHRGGGSGTQRLSWERPIAGRTQLGGPIQDRGGPHKQGAARAQPPGTGDGCGQGGRTRAGHRRGRQRRAEAEMPPESLGPGQGRMCVGPAQRLRSALLGQHRQASLPGLARGAKASWGPPHGPAVVLVVDLPAIRLQSAPLRKHPKPETRVAPGQRCILRGGLNGLAACCYRGIDLARPGTTRAATPTPVGEPCLRTAAASLPFDGMTVGMASANWLFPMIRHLLGFRWRSSRPVSQGATRSGGGRLG